MNVNDVYEQRNSFFLEAPAALKGGIYAAIGIGLLTLGYGFYADGSRTWGAFLFNLFFFFCLGLGGMAFAAMQDVIGAHWGRPIRRIQEGFGAFVPVAIALFVIYLIAVATGIGGADKVYRWIEDPSILSHFHGKDKYLVPGWFFLRVGVVLASILVLSLWQLRLSLKRDQLAMAGQKAEAEAYGQEVKEKLKFWSAPILVVYGTGFTFMGMDLVMSLSPLWFSTLWGGWQFAIMMQTLMASLLLVMFMIKGTNVGKVIQRQQFHDVGKLMHGFTIFFAYLTYAHVLTYWYGNVPEETEYFIHRLHQPWFGLVIAVPILGFLVPLYTLIFKAAKWTAWVTGPIACLILLAQWFSYLLMIQPEIVKDNSTWVPGLEIGVFFGMFGLFALTFTMFAKRNPMVPIADPLLKNALDSGHH
ncbi:hypothetical protein [Pseudobacteriovorax antillogorgiicola]|uniref:Quinol:cytochrome c oxidoreductase quinone-binding subunit 2 n=1 Tax=Pseudobacteriovorax antillogorgiicola TaxID=1513793 RepID=A0A1Y6C299_9BACT|nr:hypothetical protein [Pseudobacteriovorax antillogorgiicola]TCS50251.1 quinol:cytochrome c oxidoreductase quinone-binding subunit 2 [Pseudobacteriovorax antillogorgiicola]SMF32939.1 quinol:cytochrome c oxidoreductase quinone-binding subunit 2 [Pseudobacteriovorax antillogorgiicola]